ncbi:hypothetical protein O983_28135 [Mycobacterium avium 09-5983]|nr:hypothetical protein O983_28135 [Mycobacterium avium 09-5983]
MKAVVADKVLDLYRNPNGPTTSNSVTTPDITTARSFAPDPTRGKVEFTAAELDRCRLHTPRRRFGSIQIDRAYRPRSALHMVTVPADRHDR